MFCIETNKNSWDIAIVDYVPNSVHVVSMSGETPDDRQTAKLHYKCIVKILSSLARARTKAKAKGIKSS